MGCYGKENVFLLCDYRTSDKETAAARFEPFGPFVT